MASTTSNADDATQDASRPNWFPYAIESLALKRASEAAKQRAVDTGDAVEKRAWEVQAKRLEGEAMSAAERSGVLNDLNDRYVGETRRTSVRDSALLDKAVQEFGAQNEVRARTRDIFSNVDSNVRQFLGIRDNKSVETMAAGIAKAYRATASVEENITRKSDFITAAEQNERRASSSAAAAGRAAAEAVTDGGYSTQDIKLAENAGKKLGQDMAEGYIRTQGLLTEEQAKRQLEERPRNQQPRGTGNRRSGEVPDGSKRKARPVPVRGGLAVSDDFADIATSFMQAIAEDVTEIAAIVAPIPARNKNIRTF